MKKYIKKIYLVAFVFFYFFYSLKIDAKDNNFNSQDISGNYSIKSFQNFKSNLDTKFFKSNDYFCIDKKINSIKESLLILNLENICNQDYLLKGNGKIKVKNLNNVITITAKSPQLKANNFNYESSLFLKKGYKKEAFVPYLNISSGSIAKEYSFTNTKTNYSLYNSALSNQSLNSSSNYVLDNWSIITSLVIPIYLPQSRGLFTYYKYNSESQKNVSNSQDLEVFVNALNNAVDLWINYQLFLIGKNNLSLKISNHELTFDKYKLGLSSVSDLATSLANLRNQQNNLSQKINLYNKSFLDLAESLGINSSEISIENEFFKINSLKDIYTFKVPNHEKIKKLALVRDDNLFSYLNLYLANVGYENYYRGANFPEISGVIANSLSNSYYDYSIASNGLTTTKYNSDGNTNTSKFSINFSWNIFDFNKNKDFSTAYSKVADANLELAKQAALSSISSASQTFQTYKNMEVQLANSYQSILANKVAYEKTFLAYSGGYTDHENLNAKFQSYTSSGQLYLLDLQKNLKSRLKIMKHIKEGYFDEFQLINSKVIKKLLEKLNL